MARVLAMQRRLDSLIALHQVGTRVKRIKSQSSPKHKSIRLITPFNPNKISLEKWVELGFSKRQAEIIIKYKLKLGGFTSLEQLQKCYVISDEKFKELKSFLIINSVPAVTSRIDSLQRRKKIDVKPKVSIVKQDINIADTAQLKKIYGIGDKLARRILKYRSLLGGFVTEKQIFEVYGFLDTLLVARVWQRFYIKESPSLITIDLHEADFKTLTKHPYITSKMANSLLEFQNMFGKIRDTNRLQQLEYWDKDRVKRLSPYIKFGR